MSLLMDALKKAEASKRQADDLGVTTSTPSVPTSRMSAPPIGAPSMVAPRRIACEMPAARSSGVPAMAATSGSIELRADVFNVFNTLNLNNPNTDTTNAAYGQISSARIPRQSQFSLRFQF